MPSQEFDPLLDCTRGFENRYALLQLDPHEVFGWQQHGKPFEFREAFMHPNPPYCLVPDVSRSPRSRRSTSAHLESSSPSGTGGT